MRSWWRPENPNVVRVPFPLRAGFVAYVEVPTDMTTWEATRLSAMVKLLGMPHPNRKLLAAPIEET